MRHKWNEAFVGKIYNVVLLRKKHLNNAFESLRYFGKRQPFFPFSVKLWHNIFGFRTVSQYAISDAVTREVPKGVFCEHPHLLLRDVISL